MHIYLKTFILIMSLTVALWACGEEESDEGGAESTDTEANAGDMSGDDTSAGEMATGGTMSEAGTSTATGMGGWGDDCMTEDDCTGATTMCVKSPIDPPDMPGYCSIPCNTTSECSGSEMGWTCNVVGTCDSPSVTWCGPAGEIDDSGGFLTACN